MKRSDMVKFIATKLYYGSLAARVDNDTLTILSLAEKDAEAVLKVIEEWKMKPPFSNDIYQAECIIYIYPDGNKWEPENETK